MSAKLTQFITEWLRMNVVDRIGSAEDVSCLASKCVMEAARQGISREAIEHELGPIEECIRSALTQ